MVRDRGRLKLAMRGEHQARNTDNEFLRPRLISGNGPTSLTLALVLLIGVACGETTETGGGDTTTTPSTADPVELGNACSAPELGFDVRYPTSWVTVTSGENACRFFHPEPFTLPPETEATGIAITLDTVSMPLLEIVPGQGGTSAVDVLERRDASAADGKAVRLTTSATGRALLPAGTEAVTWYVAVPAGTLVASTNELASSGTFEDNARVLDAMMGSL